MRRFVACVAAFCLVAASSFADKPGKSKGKGKDKQQEAAVSVTFTAVQREAVRTYFVEKHGRGGCPPGLAKKHNGCLPPGQAKKRYALGQVLPKGVPTHPLPAELQVRIGDPPAGYAYFVVDGDLVKLAVGTMLVVDAIAGLVD
jgi:Ni/Co efflux regulator RcnB